MVVRIRFNGPIEIFCGVPLMYRHITMDLVAVFCRDPGAMTGSEGKLFITEGIITYDPKVFFYDSWGVGCRKYFYFC